MGRKRKADTLQDKTNNGCSETPISMEKTDISMAVSVGNGSNVKKIPNVIPPKKEPRVMDIALRRSVRISNDNSGLLSRNVRSGSVLEHVNLVENDQEEAPRTSPNVNEIDMEIEPQAQQADTPEMNGISLEEKVDYLVRAADEFKSKFVRRTNESPSDYAYKAKYFDAVKKIEALMEENYDLVRKLEFANGKIEVYESMKDALSAQREVILVSALAKATEQTANNPSQPEPTCISPPPPPATNIPESSKRKYTRKN